MPQYCLLFCAVLQSWRPKGGAMAQWPPLNTPLVAPHVIVPYNSSGCTKA